jgi:hypothetical protein
MRLKTRNGKRSKNRKDIQNDKRIRKSVVLIKHKKETETLD